MVPVLGIPFTSVGTVDPLFSAQIARSIPASASARAWATMSWLLAMVGSEAESTEKPMTSTERMSRASMAIGSATPRWSVSIRVRSRMARLSSGLVFPELHRGFHRRALVSRRPCRHALLGPRDEADLDHPDLVRGTRGGVGPAPDVVHRVGRDREGLDPADDRR